MSTATLIESKKTIINDEEKAEADKLWNSRLDYLCNRTKDVLVNIVRLHWEEGEWLNTALKDQRKYGSNIIERYVRDCEARNIKTSVSSVYKYMDFNSKYSREEVERAIGRHITWHQLAGGGISIPTPEGRDKWELAVAAGKFSTDDEALKAAREITSTEKAKVGKAKAGRSSSKTSGGSGVKATCRATNVMCTDLIKKLDDLKDGIKVVAKMDDEEKEKSELLVTIRDTFRSFLEVQKRFAALEDLRGELLEK